MCMCMCMRMRMYVYVYVYVYACVYVYVYVYVYACTNNISSEHSVNRMSNGYGINHDIGGGLHSCRYSLTFLLKPNMAALATPSMGAMRLMTSVKANSCMCVSVSVLMRMRRGE